MNIEEIKDRVNLTKNAFHKLGIEGQVNINVMLNDIEFLLKEIEELKEKNRQGKMRIVQLENEITARIEDVNQYYTSNDKIKAKIEELKDGIYDAKIVLQSLLEKE